MPNSSTAILPLLTHKESPFLKLLLEKVVVGDGAMGTEILKRQLTVDDYQGLEGLPEILCVSRPDIISEIHDSYLAVGADFVETNSFGGTAIVLEEYGQGARAFELNKAAAALAREVANTHSRKGYPRFVSGSVGPTTKLCSLGHIDFDTLVSNYTTQIEGLLAGGIDLLQIETCQDPLQVKAAVQAAHIAFVKQQRQVPIFVQVTVETTGTMLVGTDISAALTTLECLPLDGIGMNCATGPDLMREHLKFLSQHSPKYISVFPNAGLPRNVDGNAVYDLSPEQLATALREFSLDYGASIVGGCCGTGPAHIRAVVDAVQGITPRQRPASYPPHLSSLYQSVALDQDASALFVGERTNANGSKQFRELLLAEQWEAMVEMAKDQEAEGSHVLDLCTAYVGRNEVRDMTELAKRLATQISLPISIDSTQLDVIEATLKLLGGRALINSINLEDGEEKFDQLCILAKRFGAALIALTIDEEGMAKTAARKLEVAQRIHQLVTKRHGLPASCLLFDPLTFTIASGDEDSRDAGIQTLEGIRLIKEQIPEVRTLLGLSNISFGLQPYPRQVLNSVFLDEARQRGLDAAILHAKKIIPLHDLSEEALTVTRDLIFDRRRADYDPLFSFIKRFSEQQGAASGSTAQEENLSIEEILKQRIIKGNKVGLEAPLKRALEQYAPLQIINEVLLEGMKVVGELFGAGKMQLPFVLQSAETMKAAVAFLEPHMEKLEGSQKGTIVLATVRGDVHDIGKNLVDIILSNNGYKVVNLGIKQPLENILAAVREHHPNAIGLSGLLVKSTVVMKENLEELSKLDYSLPVICGGAALNRAYVEDDLRKAYSTGPVYYGLDAFTGLKIMEELTENAPPSALTQIGGDSKSRSGSMRAEREDRFKEEMYQYVAVDLPPAKSIPEPPFWGTRTLLPNDLDLREIFTFINRKALFVNQWQYRRNRTMSEEENKQFLATYVEDKFKGWQERAIDEGWLEPKAAYGFFPCNSEGNDLVVFDPADINKELVRFTFPRQLRDKRRCIADYFLPLSAKRFDLLAVQLVTMGSVASEASKKLFESDKYDDYLHFHGLSVESAEALAELMHKRIREACGFGMEDATKVEELFRQHYRGARYSFGYAACPKLEDQQKLFKLVDPASVGVTLSEEFQLHPEQSTSAIIVHHQEAVYFSI